MHQWRADVAGQFHLQVLPAVALRGLVELVIYIVGGVEGTNDPVTLDRLVGDLGNLTHGVLHLGAVTAEAPGCAADDPADDGCDHQEGQGQLPVDDEELREIEDHRQAFTENDRDGFTGGAGDLLHIVGDFGYQATGGVAIEIHGRQTCQLLVQFIPQLMHDPLGETGHGVATHEGTHAAKQGNGDTQQGAENACLFVVLRVNGVQGPAQPLGGGRSRCREDDESDDAQGEREFVVQHIAQQALVQQPTGLGIGEGRAGRAGTRRLFGMRLVH